MSLVEKNNNNSGPYGPQLHCDISKESIKLYETSYINTLLKCSGRLSRAGWESSSMKDYRKTSLYDKNIATVKLPFRKEYKNLVDSKNSFTEETIIGFIYSVRFLHLYEGFQCISALTSDEETKSLFEITSSSLRSSSLGKMRVTSVSLKEILEELLVNGEIKNPICHADRIHTIGTPMIKSIYHGTFMAAMIYCGRTSVEQLIAEDTIHCIFHNWKPRYSASSDYFNSDDHLFDGPNGPPMSEVTHMIISQLRIIMKDYEETRGISSLLCSLYDEYRKGGISSHSLGIIPYNNNKECHLNYIACFICELDDLQEKSPDVENKIDKTNSTVVLKKNSKYTKIEDISDDHLLDEIEESFKNPLRGSRKLLKSHGFNEDHGINIIRETAMDSRRVSDPVISITDIHNDEINVKHNRSSSDRSVTNKSESSIQIQIQGTPMISTQNTQCCPYKHNKVPNFNDWDMADVYNRIKRRI